MFAMASAGFAQRLASFPQKSQPLPQAGEFVRFSDPATEILVVRLTTPAYQHILPVPTNRFVSLKPRALYCSSDRAGGRLAPFQIDLRTGAVRQLAETAALDPASLCLDDQARLLYLLDGGTLSDLPVIGKHEPKHRDGLAHDVSAFSLGSSRSELFAISSGRLQHFVDDRPTLLADEAMAPCLARPGGNGCLFTRPISEVERAFWYVPTDQAGSKPFLLVQGRVTSPCWATGGESLFFLRDVPKNEIFVSEVHEVSPEAKVERCIAPTSQFAAFSANENDSVFVGASRSKAQPNLVLLLRASRRELTLCEHRASRPAEVRSAFSPDSRRVYFQSDREGESAIYSVNVEQLVEPTA